MKLEEIRQKPTQTEKLHESVFRSYYILRKVKELCVLGTAPEVILEIIEDLQKAPQKDYPVKPNAAPTRVGHCFACGERAVLMPTGQAHHVDAAGKIIEGRLVKHAAMFRDNPA